MATTGHDNWVSLIASKYDINNDNDIDDDNDNNDDDVNDNDDNNIVKIVMITIIMMIMIMIMSVFYSDKSPCSKALMISDRHQTEAGKIHTIWWKCHVALWICDLKQMCLQTTLESVNGLDTVDGDGEGVLEGRGSMRKATLAKTFQVIARCRQEMFTLGS